MARGAVGWPGQIASRLRFERGARQAYPGIRGKPMSDSSGFRYFVTIEVPFYEQRHVTVVFSEWSLKPTVLSDGPAESPHRFGNGSLCMWHPKDPPSKQWSFDHGLLDLLDAITAHLFREAWWREYGEWLGPEVPHQTAAEQKELA